MINLDNVVIQPKPKLYNFVDLTNQSFLRLTVIDYTGNSKWLCQCSCGQYTIVDAYQLVSRKTQSCGCLAREQAAQRLFVHGEGKNTCATTEYRAYSLAKNRCNNPNNRAYADYGGRGIKFCFESYQEFLADVGRRPSSQYTLDRIDNEGHYEKGNVRWATRSQQNRNKRNNRMLCVNGITQSMTDWSEKYGISVFNIFQRIKILGWCDSCAVTLPLRAKKTCNHKVNISPE